MQTTTPSISVPSTGMRFGLLLGLGWIIIDFILRQLSLSFIFYGITNLSASILVAIIVLVVAHKAYKQANEGIMSYGQGVIISLFVMMIWGIMSSLFNYLYVHYIDPEFVERLQQGMVDFMERNRVPASEIAKGTARFDDMKRNFSKSLLSGLTSGLAFGVILGLIVSIFTKRKHPEFE